MAEVVVLDACVLHPAPLRDLLLRLGHRGVFRIRWSDAILDECFVSLARARPDLEPANLRRTRRLMTRAVPEAMVDGYFPLVETLPLPDPDDRHVLAVAIRSGATTIVTSNLRDFPPVVLREYGVTARHPDPFLFDLAEELPLDVARVLEEQASALWTPPMTVPELLDRLASCGLSRFAAAMRAGRSHRSRPHRRPR